MVTHLGRVYAVHIIHAFQCNQAVADGFGELGQNLDGIEVVHAFTAS
jgi:hypothetical protein